jgi:hypothetical protein
MTSTVLMPPPETKERVARPEIRPPVERRVGLIAWLTAFVLLAALIAAAWIFLPQPAVELHDSWMNVPTGSISEIHDSWASILEMPEIHDSWMYTG